MFYTFATQECVYNNLYLGGEVGREERAQLQWLLC